MSLYFNFHDVVGLRVDTESEEGERFFFSEYRPYKVQALLENLARVTLRYSRSLPKEALSGWTRYANKIFARWAYHVEIDDRRVLIEA